MTIAKNWIKLAEEKRREICQQIPENWILPKDLLNKYDETTPVSVLDIPKQFLSSSELNITERYSVKELLECLATSKLSAIDVCNAFSHRAAIATQLTNCCTEIMFELGQERARFLDEYLEENGKPFGPLHGLPISLKDSFKVSGYDSTIGFVARISNRDEQQSDLVKQLWDLGAIFYVKTNIPQTLMTADSENNIFGRTLNPNNLTWTAGGSTGGEGALLKMRGSLLGMGTDIAGSIRIPALCNGVYGYKPSSNRYPNGNQEEPSRDDYVGVSAVSGPLSTDLEAIQMITKIVFNNNPRKYDFEALNIEYREPGTLEKSTLKIGVVLGDDMLPIHPPMKRVIRKAYEKLRDEYCDVQFIEKVPSYDKAWTLAWRLFQVDPGNTAFDDLLSMKEPLIKSLTLPGLETYGTGPKTLDELVEIKEQVKELKQQWMEIFEDYDVIISPGSPGSAPPHDKYGIAPYTTMWNLVDFPAIVIPYGQVDASVDLTDDVVYDQKLDNIYAHYDPKDYDGGVCHLQISAPHMEDENLISAAILISGLLNEPL